MKGRIEYVAEVTCGICEESFLGIAPLRRGRFTASEVLREHGWKLTKAHGWTCPSCIKSEAPEHTGDDDA